MVRGLLLCGVYVACGGRTESDGKSTATAGANSSAGSTGSASAGAGNGSSASAGSAGTDWAICSPGDACVLETQSACGPGCEPVTPDRFTPINAKYQQAFEQQRPEPPCFPPACTPDAGTAVNLPYYYAACEAGRCRVRDVRTSELSACTTSSQCQLRAGTACCACGADPIAVNSLEAAQQAFCGSSPCTGLCIGLPFPQNATCSAGHCQVVFTLDAGPAD